MLFPSNNETQAAVYFNFLTGPGCIKKSLIITSIKGAKLDATNPRRKAVCET